VRMTGRQCDTNSIDSQASSTDIATLRTSPAQSFWSEATIHKRRCGPLTFGFPFGLSAGPAASLPLLPRPALHATSLEFSTSPHFPQVINLPAFLLPHSLLRLAPQVTMLLRSHAHLQEYQGAV